MNKLLIALGFAALGFCLHGIAVAAPKAPTGPLTLKPCTAQFDATHAAFIPMRETHNAKGQLQLELFDMITTKSLKNDNIVEMGIENEFLSHTLSDLSASFRDQTEVERAQHKIIGTTRFGSTVVGINNATGSMCVRSSTWLTSWSGTGKETIRAEVAELVKTGFSKTLKVQIQEQIKLQAAEMPQVKAKLAKSDKRLFGIVP